MVIDQTPSTTVLFLGSLNAIHESFILKPFFLFSLLMQPACIFNHRIHSLTTKAQSMLCSENTRYRDKRIISGANEIIFGYPLAEPVLSQWI